MNEDIPVNLHGSQLGSYRIVERLGAGAMGTVYKAHDTDLDRYVAIKVLAQALDADPACVERFKREARAIAGLRHPNLMHVYSVGTESGVHYFAMEYIDGTPLNTYLKQHAPLDIPEAFRIAGQILSALQKVHEAGIVHRDLKPGNIMIDNDNRAVLLDFGLSKDTTQLNLTGTGTIMGTPDYMAPEQIEGEDVGPYTDIYALGVMLYEMLSNILPFRRKSAIMTMRAHCEDRPPPVSQHCKDLPSAIDKILAKAMNRNPNNRYQDIIAFADALNAVHSTPELFALASNGAVETSAPTVVVSSTGNRSIQQTNTTPRSKPRRSRRKSAKRPSVKTPDRMTLYIAVVIAVLILLIAGVFILRRRASRQQVKSPDNTTASLPRETYIPKQGGEIPAVYQSKVRVFLKSGEVIRGNLLSVDNESVTVEDIREQAPKTIPLEAIVFLKTVHPTEAHITGER